nr:hypothetical protein [Tanacetum cinerariifolium]
MENEHELSYETLTRVYLGSYEHYTSVREEVELLEPEFELQGSRMVVNSGSISTRHIRGLEDDEEGLYDVLFKLESRLDVLFCPCDAAAKDRRKGNHVGHKKYPLVPWGGAMRKVKIKKTHIVGMVWSGEYMNHGLTKSMKEVDMRYTMLEELRSMIVGEEMIHKNREGNNYEGSGIRPTIGGSINTLLHNLANAMKNCNGNFSLQICNGLQHICNGLAMTQKAVVNPLQILK